MTLELPKYCPNCHVKLWHIQYKPQPLQQQRAMLSANKDATEGKAISAAIRAGVIVLGQLGIVNFYFCKICHHVSK